ncbi:Transposable element Hobo transposase [Labeo rohita]|uniref:Transposable element Hobo transposase n=1 Tax=Labeo rohita TaxID=84645 RepID=A0A498LRZ9_LABRO|nr:Transposable element Hobo transposase [Labeo rohita]
MEGANTRGEVDVAKNDLQRKVRSNDMSKSEILSKFMRVECDGDCTMYAACKTCLVLVKYGSDSGTSGLKRHTCKANSGKNQPSIASFIKRKLLSGVKSRLTDKIARMCSQDLRPFAVVEGKGFTNVAQELLNIGAKYGSNVQVEDILPCARTVSRHVEGEYVKIKLLVMEEFRQYTDKRLSVGRFSFFALNKARVEKKPWVQKVYSSLREGYIKAATFLLKNLPLNNNIITSLSALTPSLILHESVQGAFNTLAKALPNAVKSEELGQLDEEVRAYQINTDLGAQAKCFEENNARIDVDWWS